MIKATELRVGNLILPRHDTEEYVTVTDIDEYGNIGTTAFFYDGKGTTGTVIESAMGIPLTPDLLKRYGFEDDEHGRWTGPKFETDNTIQWFEIEVDDRHKGYYWLRGSEWCMGRPFQFLHQLQNLYHALVYEELPIKEQS